MFKTGIYKIDQLINGNVSFSNKNISIDLYSQIKNIDIKNKEKITELILERFSFSDGTYKRTHSNRFSNFDNYIIKYLKENYKSSNVIKVHDIAISDGRTSLAFYNKLKQNFNNVIFFGSDKENIVYVYESKKNRRNKIITDSQNNILQIVFPPFVINVFTPKMAKLYKLKNIILFPVNFVLLKMMQVSFLRNFFIPIDTDNPKVLNLFNSAICDCERKNKNFTLTNYNLLESSLYSFDIIRVMNVINSTYFNKHDISIIIRNLFNSLNKNGILIIGSNEDADSQVHGNIFLKIDNGFRSIKQFGHGLFFRKEFEKDLKIT